MRLDVTQEGFGDPSARARLLIVGGAVVVAALLLAGSLAGALVAMLGAR